MKKFEKRKNIKENSNLDAKKATSDDSLEQVSGGSLSCREPIHTAYGDVVYPGRPSENGPSRVEHPFNGQRTPENQGCINR